MTPLFAGFYVHPKVIYRPWKIYRGSNLSQNERTRKIDHLHSHSPSIKQSGMSKSYSFLERRPATFLSFPAEKADAAPFSITNHYSSWWTVGIINDYTSNCRGILAGQFPRDCILHSAKNQCFRYSQDIFSIQTAIYCLHNAPEYSANWVFQHENKHGRVLGWTKTSSRYFLIVSKTNSPLLAQSVGWQSEIKPYPCPRAVSRIEIKVREDPRFITNFSLFAWS